MAKKIILKGQVQGVCCRQYCSQYGRFMHLRGSATNLANGNVQVILQTEDDSTARRYVSALLTNPNNYRFYGAITDIEMNDHSGSSHGDYEF